MSNSTCSLYPSLIDRLAAFNNSVAYCWTGGACSATIYTCSNANKAIAIVSTCVDTVNCIEEYNLTVSPINLSNMTALTTSCTNHITTNDLPLLIALPLIPVIMKIFNLIIQAKFGQPRVRESAMMTLEIGITGATLSYTLAVFFGADDRFATVFLVYSLVRYCFIGVIRLFLTVTSLFVFAGLSQYTIYQVACKNLFIALCLHLWLPIVIIICTSCGGVQEGETVNSLMMSIIAVSGWALAASTIYIDSQFLFLPYSLYGLIACASAMGVVLLVSCCSGGALNPEGEAPKGSSKTLLVILPLIAVLFNIMALSVNYDEQMSGLPLAVNLMLVVENGVSFIAAMFIFGEV